MGILGQSVMGQYIFSITKNGLFFVNIAHFTENGSSESLCGLWHPGELRRFNYGLKSSSKAHSGELSIRLLIITSPLFFYQYSINRSQLSTRSLSISVWHHGRLSRNAFLGEVEIPLDCRDLDSPQEERMALLAKVEKRFCALSLRSFLVAMLKLNKWLVYPWGLMQSVHLQCAEQVEFAHILNCVLGACTDAPPSLSTEGRINDYLDHMTNTNKAGPF